MKKFTLAVLSLFVFTQLSFAQQESTAINRVGDAFRGHIRQVRSENVQVRAKDHVTIEGPRSLTQIINYSEDGRRRESEAYARGLLLTKRIDTFLPGGQLESTSVYDGEGSLVSKMGYEYDPAGRLTIETQFLADGSVKEKKINHWNNSPALVAVTKSNADGLTVQTSTNSNNYSTRNAASGEPKRSVWTTTKADGSRTENIFEVDSNGTHNDQQIYYGPDGSLTGKRVSIVDAETTRLEATEYDGSGNVTTRTLQTREYDSQHNVNKITVFRWNAERKEFEPFNIVYHTITYYR